MIATYTYMQHTYIHIHTHIPEEHNNNDKSMVTTFEQTGTGKAFWEYLCEICGAKQVNT